jgi:murein tripeptide amidase MpaA
MKNLLLIFLITSCLPVTAKEIQTPLQKNNYSRYTSYEELTAYVHQLEKSSGLLRVETIGQSVKGRNLMAMKFSSGEFVKDPSKIKSFFSHNNMETNHREKKVPFSWHRRF